MKIYNNENILTNKQIKKCISKFNIDIGEDICIVVLERRMDFLTHKFNIFFIRLIIMIRSFLGVEGGYLPYLGVITICIYNIDGNIDDKKLFSIGVLLHELYHYSGELNEEKCDDVVKNFLNRHSEFIYNTLKLKCEYEVEEF